MSRLYYTEQGRVIPNLYEGLTEHRHTRKVLDLPETSVPAALYFLARPHPTCRRPLLLTVNGEELSPVSPMTPGAYSWYELSVDPERLKGGQNEFVFRTTESAMDGWSLAIEAGHERPDSFVSGDGGENWRNGAMGYLNNLRGEYVVRLRLAEGEDPAPPPVVWEDPDDPRCAALRTELPAEAREGKTRLEQVRALLSWISSRWIHTGGRPSQEYGPWHAETLLSWGKAESGYSGRLPNQMCVHFSAAFVSCCQVLGIPARCAVITEAINGWNGHFMAEVWLDECDKWILVDPLTDALFQKDGELLSMREVQQLGSRVGPHIEWGKGTSYQLKSPHVEKFVRQNLEKGVCLRHRSIWYRADLLSHPELSPPGHGSLAYCETGLVWETAYREKGFGMFPFFADDDYFDAKPSDAF